MPVRVYTPAGDAEVRPGVVYFHGGGWVLGDLETHDRCAATLANGAGAVVVSVDYRLAPEHRFPAAAEDALRRARAGSRRTPPSSAVDAGAHRRRAATARAATWRPSSARWRATEAAPTIAFQLLIYPVTDHDFDDAVVRRATATATC